MKTKYLLFSAVILILQSAICVFNCSAQGTWLQKANFTGTTREMAVGFSIIAKGYFGTGIDRTGTTVSTGNIGIRTNAPQRRLHVSDVMRLEPRVTAPANASAGDIYFDSTVNKLMGYDGTAWQACCDDLLQKGHIFYLHFYSELSSTSFCVF